MEALAGAVAFFDIGNTLASVNLLPGNSIELTAYRYVPQVLTRLRDEGVRLGIVSDRDQIPAESVDRALDAAGLSSFCEPGLVVYGKKDSPLIFEDAAARAGVQPGRGVLLFVGEDASERAMARKADFLVAPHPRLAVSALGRARMRYVRITVPDGFARHEWRASLADLPLLPLHVTGEAQRTVYAIVTSDAAARLDDLGFFVDRLGDEDEPLTTDLYLLRDDRQRRSGFLQPTGNSAEFFESGPASRRVLASTGEGLFVAIPAGRSVEGSHFREAQHGHNLKLVPSLGLLDTFDDPHNARLAAGMDAAPALAPPALSTAEKKALRSKVTKVRLARDVDRYSGVRPVTKGGARLQSRHIHHADNARAVDALDGDLQAIGGGRLQVRRHRFTHEGRSLENVEGELVANGLDGLVLVTAHIDSTAARQPGFRPSLDAAPGADDDGSGVAGVLAAANAIEALDATVSVPRRAVRFVFFNAEEHGLAGSRAYARDQAALGTPIVAVFQMDMIGFDVASGRTFELHAGFTPSTAVQDRSVALAQLVSDVLPQVSPRLPPAQIFAADDPAESRSDHYSFQLEGYAACLASEDYFAGPGPGAPQPDPNPEYHLSTDTVVNAGYAADIARAMTGAAWVAATR